MAQKRKQFVSIVCTVLEVGDCAPGDHQGSQALHQCPGVLSLSVLDGANTPTSTFSAVGWGEMET